MRDNETIEEFIERVRPKKPDEILLENPDADSEMEAQEQLSFWRESLGLDNSSSYEEVIAEIRRRKEAGEDI